MDTTINTKQLRGSLPKLVKRVRQGARFTVLYRSRPAFRIVPIDPGPTPAANLRTDSLYRARPVGRSMDGRASADHDADLYGR
jgi:antitoxin (DNA-binding transcriptional repressor) of toxin-antitoxin stability system